MENTIVNLQKIQNIASTNNESFSNTSIFNVLESRKQLCKIYLKYGDKTILDAINYQNETIEKFFNL